jgi:hypothetical protein
MIWFIYRPKLRATFGGITLFQGSKAHYLQAEIFDFRVGLPLPEDNTNWECPNGVTITMREPLKAFDISYREPDGDIQFDVELRASMPPALRYNGNHIGQAMRTAGTLVMSGRAFKIDGHYTRDRSWDDHRNEASHRIPPVSWIAGVFGDDFAFHLTSFESRDRRPEWAGLYEQPGPGENLLWGYIWDGGKLIGVDRAELFIERRGGIHPASAEIVLHGSNGKDYRIDGRTIALNPAMGWPNISVNYALTEWRCSGRIGWGDIQDVIYRDHFRHVTGSGAGTFD